MEHGFCSTETEYVGTNGLSRRAGRDLLRGDGRELGEQPRAADIEAAERELGSLPLEVLEGGTLEEAFEALAAKYPGQPRVVIADSLQTTRTRQSAKIESLRERIADVVRTAKRCCRDPKTAAICIFTSELARGAYRSKRQEDQSNPLAAFKESGDIEYGVDVALVLKNVKGENNAIQVEIVKNRLGTKGEFGLRLDFESATFVPSKAASGRMALGSTKGGQATSSQRRQSSVSRAHFRSTINPRKARVPNS